MTLWRAWADDARTDGRCVWLHRQLASSSFHFGNIHQYIFPHSSISGRRAHTHYDHLCLREPQRTRKAHGRRARLSTVSHLNAHKSYNIAYLWATHTSITKPLVVRQLRRGGCLGRHRAQYYAVIYGWVPPFMLFARARHKQIPQQLYIQPEQKTNASGHISARRF